MEKVKRRKAELTGGFGGRSGPGLAGWTWTTSGSCPMSLLQLQQLGEFQLSSGVLLGLKSRENSNSSFVFTVYETMVKLGI